MTKARDLAGASIVPAAVSNTELGFLDGVTSAVQTQLDAKAVPANVINNTFVDAKGDLITATADNTPTRLAVGTNGQVLTADSTTLTGLKYATPSAGAAFTGCSAYKSVDQSVSSDTATLLTWDLENYDTNSFHDNATNNSRFTIPTGKGGYYQVTGSIHWDTRSTGFRQIQLFKNATKINESLAGAKGNLNNRSAVGFAFVFAAAAADYIEFYGSQDSGTPLAVLSGAISSTVQITYLGA